MIQPLSATATAATFQLPKEISATDPTIEAFGNVYEANRTQFATRETADALASLLGGKVSDLSEQWGMGHISPLYQIDFNGGVSLNAGLLADRFQRYGTEAALRMTQVELGQNPTPLTSTNVVTSSAAKPAADPVASDAATTAAAAEKTKLADAAKQFESLLMAQILKSATPEGEDGLLSGSGDSSTQSLYQLALENFAAVLGQQGGLGLAGSVTGQLENTGSTTSIRG
jgi:hypothetical protein